MTMNATQTFRTALATAALCLLTGGATHAQLARLADGPPPDPNPQSKRIGVERLPDEPGRGVVAEVCSRCHSLQSIAKERRTARQWQAIVPLMVNRLDGADVPAEEDVRAVEKYLSDHWSRPQTAAEAAAQDPLRELDAPLPLAEARDLSGTWMTAMWYTMLNMGPSDGLPISRDFRSTVNPRKDIGEARSAWARQKSKDWTAYNDPLNTCNSPGPLAYNNPYAFEILHSPQRVTLITEYFHEVRRFYMDGRQHPPGNPDPTAMGHSIARWEGATLVVDTRNFKESPAFQVPWSDQLHLIERIRRVKDGNVLEIEVTIEDPVAFTEPLRGTFFFKKDPSLQLSEWNCDGFFDYTPFAPKEESAP
jgi:hypothetical protein